MLHPTRLVGRSVRDEAVVTALDVLAHHPSALITDIDGTISPIVARPEDAVVSLEIVSALDALAGCIDTVAVITAREEAVARQMVPAEGLTFVGNYGLDREGAERVGDCDLTAIRNTVRARLQHLPGVMLEDKDISFALHYRNCAEPNAARAELLATLQPHLPAAGARLLEGKQVVEVVPAGLPGKDSAIANLATQRHLNGIVYLGDDVADIAVFHEIARRRIAGYPGLAIAVLDEETPAEIQQTADITLTSVGELEEFLTTIVRSLTDEGAQK